MREHIDYEKANRERVSMLNLTGGPVNGGLTVLDYFAGLAMQALIARYGDVSHICEDGDRTSLYFAAYDHAESMLKERERVTQNND